MDGAGTSTDRGPDRPWLVRGRGGLAWPRLRWIEMAEVRRKGGLLRSIRESRHATREWLLGLLPSKIGMRLLDRSRGVAVAQLLAGRYMYTLTVDPSRQRRSGLAVWRPARGRSS